MSKKDKKAKRERNAAAEEGRPKPPPAIGAQLGEALKVAGLQKVADLKEREREERRREEAAKRAAVKAAAVASAALTSAPAPASSPTSTSTSTKDGGERPRAKYTAGEIAALNDAYRGARPLKPKSPVSRRVPVPAPVAPVIDPLALAADREARERLGALVAGDVKFEMQAERDGFVQALRQGASRKLLQAVQGKSFAPDATLDLHGFRAAEAASRVHDFVRNEHKRGARRLLLIVGKGSHSEDGASVLGPVVREALIRSGAAPLVQAFASAHDSLGGRGALAVLLR